MTHSMISDLSKGDNYRLSMDARFAALEEMIAVAQAKKEEFVSKRLAISPDRGRAA